ncbi:RFC4 [Symbiodinium sp. CCMP2592]|nr:RFC4 [Symbiodinium sp. CCMP2592]
MLAPWAPALALVLAGAQRVVPSWRQVPGDVDWFDGCGYGNEIIRGSISAGLEHNKVRKHVAMCLSHCGPPSCTLKAADPGDGLRLLEVHDVLSFKRTRDQTRFVRASGSPGSSSPQMGSAGSGGGCEVNCNAAFGRWTCGPSGVLRGSSDAWPDGLPWVEKYRPERIEEVAQQEEVVSALKHSLQTGELPNLMFYGPPGTGKTTVALALMKQFFGKDWRSRVKELNASDERGIVAVREKVKTFAQLAIGGESLSESKARFRVIILDEADSMTHDAQAALRRIMEEFVHVTRFIIICNYVSKIIEPLHSRCSKFRFQLVGAEFQKARLLHICEKEKVAVSPGALEQLIFLSKGDMRCAVTMLQTAVQVYDKVDEDSLVEVFCAVPDSKTRELLARCRSSQTTDQVLEAVRDFLLEGFSGLQVMEQLQELLAEDVSLQDAVKAKCAVLFSQAEERLCQGCDEELQLFELFSNLRPLIQAR